MQNKIKNIAIKVKTINTKNTHTNSKGYMQ